MCFILLISTPSETFYKIDFNQIISVILYTSLSCVFLEHFHNVYLRLLFRTLLFLTLFMHFINYIHFSDEHFSEEHQSMLGFHPDNYTKVVKVTNVCEDVENNNTENKDNTFDDKAVLTQYSSNSKGVFAQVRIGVMYLSENIIKYHLICHGKLNSV